jgi:hypothetical protein
MAGRKISVRISQALSMDIIFGGGGGGGGGGSYPARITGKSGSYYSIDKYENGMFNPTTGTGRLVLVEAGLSYNLPVGTWVIAHTSVVDTLPGP